jgi:hypothetical protein
MRVVAVCRSKALRYMCPGDAENGRVPNMKALSTHLNTDTEESLE